jgi:Ni/Co efflux regulator RcnB
MQRILCVIVSSSLCFADWSAPYSSLAAGGAAQSARAEYVARRQEQRRQHRRMVEQRQYEDRCLRQMRGQWLRGREAESPWEGSTGLVLPPLRLPYF